MQSKSTYIAFFHKSAKPQGKTRVNKKRKFEKLEECNKNIYYTVFRDEDDGDQKRAM